MVEKNEYDDFAKGILIGFLTGVAAGAAAGLLFAPKSGKEFRKDIHERADTVITNAEDIVAAVGTHDGVLGPPEKKPWLSEKDVGELARGEMKGE